jgi:hypothetical protein
VVQSKGGFRIRHGDAPAINERIAVKVAYDLPDGNPFSAYSRLDFVFDAAGTGRSIPIAARGARVENPSGNCFEVVTEALGFEVIVDGFDTSRGDLCIRANVQPREEPGDDPTL